MPTQSFPKLSINPCYCCQVAIIVFGLVSGGGVTGRSSETEQTAVTPADLTGGVYCVLSINNDVNKSPMRWHFIG